jgi:hypothetical protein
MSWVMKQRLHQIELFMKYPHEVQQDWFRKLISAAKDTEFGRMYDFTSIYSVQQFKERVPIRNYDSMKPFIDRVRSGEQNVLWNTPIKWFAKSSGTTADKSKFIPVSEESLEECHFKAGKDMLSIYCSNNPNSQLFSGKSLTIGGSHQISQLNSDSYQGDLSAILMQNLPFWAQFVTTPNLSIALMNEWESKIEMMARATINENVTSLAGVPSWTLLLMKHILKLSNKKNLLEVWPNLELFFHGGVSFTPYREQFKALTPSSQMTYFETYNASEGFFGLQDQKNSEELLLMLDYGVFYEFLPMEWNHLENPKTLGLDDVKLDVNYALIISTNGGLWRYKIGDTIKFTSLSPFRIKISGRTRHFMNAFGEELIIENAEQALARACEKTNAIIKEYTAAPVFFADTKNGAHEWLIEFEKQPSDLNLFGDIFDNALKAINSDYEAKRYHNMLLKEPIIKSVPTFTFYHWLKSKNKLGGQNKVPRLSNDRKYIEELYELNPSLKNLGEHIN